MCVCDGAGIGAYRTDAGKPYVLPVVKEVSTRHEDIIDSEPAIL